MTRPPRAHRRPSAGDEGQVLVLLAGLLAIAVALVLLVADQSRLFLERRALVAAADAAAEHAAQALDEPALYQNGAGSALPLGESGARAEVDAYLVAAALPERFGALAVTDVRLDGDAVVVTLTERVPMPLRRLVAGSGGGVQISATARARAAVLGGP